MTPEVIDQGKVEPPAPSRLAKATSALWRFFSIENRYLPPLLITAILLVGQLWAARKFSTNAAGHRRRHRSRTGSGPPRLRQVSASGQRIHYGHQRRHSDSFARILAVRIVQRDRDHLEVRDSLEGRHLWNPSNFAICAMLLLAPEYFATLSVQWGNTIWPMLIVWTLGALISGA